MLDSEKLAIAAHLHVLMRRKLGRVTDVEWMVKNREYALDVIRGARAEHQAELTEWVDKLEATVVGPHPAPKRPQPASNTVPGALTTVHHAPEQGRDSQHSDLGFLDSAHGGGRYVGRLR